MPALTIDSLEAPGLQARHKGGNFASRNPGVILVFCIVFIVFLGLLSLFLYRQWLKRMAQKQNFETTEA
ncbi:hypothetical protein N7470_009287 [Penicillium chermesinum]|nr:hypothetical protein N7470_009287 [Penicillium chermesinum]